MIVRAIDENNDWVFGKGKNDYKYGVDAITQSIKTRLQSFLGDCFFDKQAGVDWFNLMGSKNRLAIQLSVNSIILNTQNVTGIISSSFTVNADRHMTLNYTVSTFVGTVSDIIPLQYVVYNYGLLLTGNSQPLTDEDGNPLITEQEQE